MYEEYNDEESAKIVSEITYGKKAVGLTFNPSGDEKVNKIKVLYSEIIDLMDELRNSKIPEGMINSNERNRLASIAITEAQTAQMWAVKAITWK